MKEILPMSLPALINRLPAPVMGRFHNEWTRREAASAKIILLDIHWYISIPSAFKLIEKLKRINPAAVVITGGVSASLFRDQLARDARIDYIITGDAEIPLQQLTEALLNGQQIEKIPNVISRRHVSASQYCLTVRDMDQSDYRDISFFPTLEKRIYDIHRRSHGHAFPVYPYLTVYRGCPLDCEECCGSTKYQRRAFGRDMTLRSPEKVREDLLYWSKHPAIRFVNMFHDIAGILPHSYTEKVFSESYDLHCFQDFFGLPSKEMLEMFLAAFKGGKVLFSLDKKHGTSTELQEASELIRCIRQVQKTGRYEVMLTYVKRFRQRPEYAAGLETILKATNVPLYKADFWWEHNPLPDAQGKGTEEDYRKSRRNLGRRYFIMDRIYRTGARLHRYFPGLMENISRYFLS